MQFHGTIMGHIVLILVDNGYTHNFISTRLVMELKLPVLEVPPFGVTIGNGAAIPYNQIFPEVTIQMPVLIMKQEFFPMTLGCAEIIMGITGLHL